MAAWTVPVALAAGTALLGAYSGHRTRKQQQQNYDQTRSDRKKEQSLATIRNQPATTQVGPQPTASPWLSGLQGGLAGATMGMNINSAMAQQKMLDAQTALLNKQAAEYASTAGGVEGLQGLQKTSMMQGAQGSNSLMPQQQKSNYQMGNPAMMNPDMGSRYGMPNTNMQRPQFLNYADQYRRPSNAGMGMGNIQSTWVTQPRFQK